MGFFEERFLVAPVWGYAESLRQELNELSSLERHGLAHFENRDHDVIQQCEVVTERVIFARKVVDPVEVTDAELTLVQDAIAGLTTQIQSWRRTFASDAGTYAEHDQRAIRDVVVRAIDELRSHLRTWVRYPEMASEAARRAAARLQEEQGHAAARLAQVSADADVMFAAVEDRLKNVGAEISADRTQISAELDRVRLAAKSAEDAATKDRERRTAEFQEELAQRATEINGMTDEWTATRAGDAVEQSTRFDATIAKAEQALKAVQKTVLTTDFGVRAQTAGKAALLWSIGTVAALVVAGGAAFVLLVNHQGGDFSWTFLFSRLSVSVIALALAGYCGSQAASHRGEERRTKRAQIVLSTMDAYLTDLPPGEAMELRQEIARSVFLSPEADEAPDHKGTLDHLRKLRLLGANSGAEKQ